MEGIEVQDFELTFIGEYQKNKLSILVRMGYHLIDGMIGFPSDFTRVRGCTGLNSHRELEMTSGITMWRI